MANHSCVVELQKNCIPSWCFAFSFWFPIKNKKRNEWFQTWKMISLSGSILPNSGPIPVHVPRKLWIQPTQIGKGLLVVNILGISSYWCFYYIGIYWLYTFPFRKNLGCSWIFMPCPTLGTHLHHLYHLYPTEIPHSRTVRTQASEPTAAVKAKILQIIWENHGKSTRNHGFFFRFLPFMMLLSKMMNGNLATFYNKSVMHICMSVWLAGWMAVCLYVRLSVRLYVCNVCMDDKSGWDANQQEHVDECS